MLVPIDSLLYKKIDVWSYFFWSYHIDIKTGICLPAGSYGGRQKRGGWSWSACGGA